MILLITFSSSKVEVQINDVGAVLVALRGAQLPCKLRLEERIRGDPYGVPVHATCLHAPISLNMILDSLHHHLRSPALVLGRLSAALISTLQHAPF